eukprot:m.326818 g.326818  ORF g.326818 m.326818 type:complete len:605 (-) comp16022_c1_seq18:6653-8467(-)
MFIYCHTATASRTTLSQEQTGTMQTVASEVQQQEPLVVGGVPEHFNLPWHLAQERGLFDKYGVKVEFREQKLGTGAMINGAKTGELDVIVALTEGLVKDIASGSNLRLLGTYVGSPLCWAISTGTRSKIQTAEDLRGGTFAISRPGSGSNLMAYVLAMERGWNPETDVKFETKGNITQLCEGVNDLSTDAFLWETFTTKPYHDDGTVRRVGDVTTPWPCFMLAATTDVLGTKLDQIRRATLAVHEAAQMFHEEQDTMPSLIAERYGLRLEDATQWYSQVSIVAERYISPAALSKTIAILQTCGQLDKDKEYDVSTLVDPELAELRHDLTSMGLYERESLVRYLYRQLQANGKERGLLSYQDLLPFDQHHYHGTDAVDQAIQSCRITNDSLVVNIGSGLGGPARYMAGAKGARVIASELLPELHRASQELTERCQLQHLVTHLGGDFTETATTIARASVNAVVSWLTILHFDDRVALFKQCYDLLAPGGYFFAADFYQRSPLTKRERLVLETNVGCSTLAPSLLDYQQELVRAGFKIIRVEDTTDDFTTYTSQRAESFESDKSLVELLDTSDHQAMANFYKQVAQLYKDGNLGGLVVVAQKPVGW